MEVGRPRVWIGGAHAVEETVKARPRSVKELWILHGLKAELIPELVRRARAVGARVRFVAQGELDRVTGGGRHQGLAVLVLAAAGEGLGAFLDDLSDEDRKGAVLVALDQIQDPHNLGAVARSALNLGAAGLILPDRRAAPVTPAAVSASAGAIQKLKVFTVVNLAQTLGLLKERGFWIYGADAAGRPAWGAVLGFPLVLVIGSEGEGLRPLVRRACDALIAVPQARSGVGSLNASCAASVLLYEAARRRAGGGEIQRPRAGGD